jgi:hypothetical protein
MHLECIMIIAIIDHFDLFLPRNFIVLAQMLRLIAVLNPVFP